MKRWILFLSIFFLLLVGCDISQDEIAPDSESGSIIIGTTIMPSVTPVTSDKPDLPTPTSTIIPTNTPTVSLPPTVTQPPLETFNLPALTAGQEVTITHITMIDTTYGWAIGNQTRSGDRILFTQDGGQSWNERSPSIPTSSQPNPDSYDAWGYFYDQHTAWVIYLPENEPPPPQAPVVWRTQDSGQTWEPSEPLAISGGEAYFVPENFFFIDPIQGWLLVHVGAGMSHDYSNLYATSDGGRTWQKLIDPYGGGIQSLHNTGFAFADPKFGWVTKDNLAVMPGTFLEQTSDGGLTWENIFLPTPPDIDWFKEMIQCATSFPTFLEPETGIVLVNCHNFEGQTFNYVYRTTDRGNTWQSTLLPTSTESLIFINPQIGLALGRDLYQSTDGGLSWVKIKTVNWDGQFSFVEEYTGWAVAHNGSAIALVVTQDGGKTWQQINPIIQ